MSRKSTSAVTPYVYNWQVELYRKLAAPRWNHTKITWIYNQVGSRGKADFMECCRDRFGALTINVKKERSIGFLIRKALRFGISPKYIIIRLTDIGAGDRAWAELRGLAEGKLIVGRRMEPAIDLGKIRVVVFAQWKPDADDDTTPFKWNFGRIAEQEQNGEFNYNLEWETSLQY